MADEEILATEECGAEEAVTPCAPDEAGAMEEETLGEAEVAEQTDACEAAECAAEPEVDEPKPTE